MNWLNTTSTAAARPEGCDPLPAGTHLVALQSLKFISKVDKIVAEFVTPDGSRYFTEWLGMATDGQKGRTGAFVRRLGELAGLRAPDFTGPDALNEYGQQLVAAGTRLRLVLVDDEYNGAVRQVIAGKFDEAMLPAVAPKKAF